MILLPLFDHAGKYLWDHLMESLPFTDCTFDEYVILVNNILHLYNGKYVINDGGCDEHFVFHNESDAALFLLTWG